MPRVQRHPKERSMVWFKGVCGTERFNSFFLSLRVALKTASRFNVDFRNADSQNINSVMTMMTSFDPLLTLPSRG
jgi:hypothetical protein